MKKSLIFATISILVGYVNSQAHTVCTEVPNETFVRNSVGCDYWHLCRNNQIAASSRCPDKFNFNPIRQTCQYADIVDCSACSLSGIQNLASEYSCNQFIRCNNGVPTVTNCPAGETFNRRIGLCDTSGNCTLPETTTTQGSTPIHESTTPTQPTTTISTTEPTSSPSVPTDPTSPSDGTTIPNETTTPSIPTTEVPNVCSGVQVYHAHPTDCSKFILCAANQQQVMKCPSGLHWNQWVNACDIPSNANCVI